MTRTTQTRLTTTHTRMIAPNHKTRLLAGLFLTLIAGKSVAESLEIKITYLEQEVDRAPVLSKLVTRPEDEGEQGAMVGIADNNTTGKFLKQVYILDKILLNKDDDLLSVAKKALQGSQLIIANVSADKLQAIADLPEAQDDLIINAGSADNALRNNECRANVLHTLPSRAMLTDALMQFFSMRKWDSLFLLQGNRLVDSLFAASLKQSAKKYRISIDHEKRWIDDGDMRRNAAAEIPRFTQARKYDAIVVADEDDDFGQYVLYNAWLPRPVTGTAGLEPVAWDRVIEQWGAVQLQNRFTEAANRPMSSVDYAAWAAVRTIGEAVTRLKNTDPKKLKDYIRSDNFSLAGFKGAKMTYRRWNGQLRQPIPLVHSQSLVALAPIEGFLHHTTELDTLGLDQPESSCRGME